MCCAMARKVVTVLLAFGLTAGCVRGGGRGPDSTVPSGSSPSTAPPTSTSAPPDIATIPAVIDEAYLDRVLAAIEEVDGRATRIIVERKRLVPEATDLMAAIYDDEEFSQQVDVWVKTIERDPQFSSFRPTPGDRLTKVARIIASSSSCVWISVTRDYSPITTRVTGPERDLEYLALIPKQPRAGGAGLNPTAWLVAWDGLHTDGSEPEDKCVAR